MNFNEFQNEMLCFRDLRLAEYFIVMPHVVGLWTMSVHRFVGHSGCWVVKMWCPVFLKVPGTWQP